jgi:hypothetical protein
VDLSVLELIGKATNTPYWRCIPNGTPDEVVVESARKSFEGLTPRMKIGMVQVMLRKYGENVAVTQQLDAPTQEALVRVYSTRLPRTGSTVDPFTWQGFAPLFFNVPMPWETVAQAPGAARAN